MILACKFTGKPEKPGFGTTLFMNDGRVFYFSSGRARSHFACKRKMTTAVKQ